MTRHRERHIVAPFVVKGDNMTDTIKIKGGKGNVPELEDREPGYSKDEEALYIGTKNGNVRLCGKQDSLRIEQNATKIEELSSQISALNGQIETLRSNIEELTARLNAMTSE